VAVSTGEFERAYQRLERPLFNYLYRWTWDADKARDLIHDAFEKLWQSRDKITFESFDALVWTTVINLARNRWRRDRILRWLPLTEPVLDDRTPDSVHDHLDRDRRVRQALDRLPRLQREVMLLGLYSGLERAEQARLLNVPEGTLASRKHAAVRTLQTMLGDSP